MAEDNVQYLACAVHGACNFLFLYVLLMLLYTGIDLSLESIRLVSCARSFVFWFVAS